MAGGQMTLTARKRRFVELYLVGGNATRAAQTAGYSARTAKQQGSRLLQEPAIAAAVAAGQAEQKKAAVADRDARQAFWTQVMLAKGRFKKAAMKDRLKASELLGKSQGDFIERHEHAGKDGLPIGLKVTFGGRYKPVEATT
jgi:phage terminase small subunit